MGGEYVPLSGYEIKFAGKRNGKNNGNGILLSDRKKTEKKKTFTVNFSFGDSF